MRVAFIAAECEPWAKTGGLADVVDGLARALSRIAHGPDQPVDVFLPRYRAVPVPAGDHPTTVLQVPDPTAAGGITQVRLLEVAGNGYRLRLVDHPPAFDREGLYGDEAGDHPDNAWRFGLLCRAALEALRRDPVPPDVIHLHDWHACPAVLLRDAFFAADPLLNGAATFLTVHNLAYHGRVPASRVPELGFGAGAEAIGVDADGLDLLGAGIDRADLVNTVSPGYATEALGPKAGMGLDGRLRARGDTFFGILNGLDPDAWNPATDGEIAATYDRADRSGKAACRAALLDRVGFDPADRRAVIGMIGRLDPQKGFDLLADAAPELLAAGARLVVLGSGHPRLAARLRVIAADRPREVALLERFDRALARQIYAGADLFAMPSRFEPCGQGQMIAYRYGTPPIVRRTGGLADTVVDVTAEPGRGTGFVFESPTAAALIGACRRAIELHSVGGSAWDALVDRGMALDFAWESASAPRYMDAYRRAVDLRRAAITA